MTKKQQSLKQGITQINQKYTGSKVELERPLSPIKANLAYYAVRSNNLTPIALILFYAMTSFSFGALTYVPYDWLAKIIALLLLLIETWLIVTLFLQVLFVRYVKVTEKAYHKTMTYPYVRNTIALTFATIFLLAAYFVVIISYNATSPYQYLGMSYLLVTISWFVLILLFLFHRDDGFYFLDEYAQAIKHAIHPDKASKSLQNCL